MDAPSVRHIQVPRIQHQTTLAGPPVNKGVLTVVATDETRPIMENANEIVAKFVNSRLKEPVERVDDYLVEFIGCKDGLLYPSSASAAASSSRCCS